MKYLILIFFIWSVTFSAWGSPCEALKAEYTKYRKTIFAKPQKCEKNHSCLLVFNGAKQDSCDLGAALSKVATSANALSKLQNLKKNIEAQCPEMDMDVCAAIPHSKAICKNGICETE